MKKFKLISKPVSEVYEMTCNRCGYKYSVTENPSVGEKYRMQSQFHSFELKFGYYSRHDGEQWDFDLCENCLEEITSTFVYKPY